MARFIRQSGTGSASAEPDVVVIAIRVMCKDDEVARAFADAGSAAHAVVAAARSAGVAQRDIATTGVDLQVVETGPWEARRPDGYRAAESLTLAVREVASASAVLQALAAAGGDAISIQSVSFGLTDPSGPMMAAREAAFADAAAKAEQYARLARAELGAALTITDGGRQHSGPPMELRVMGSEPGGEGPALEVGTNVVTAEVTVEWELRDPTQ